MRRLLAVLPLAAVVLSAPTVYDSADFWRAVGFGTAAFAIGTAVAYATVHATREQDARTWSMTNFCVCLAACALLALLSARAEVWPLVVLFAAIFLRVLVVGVFRMGLAFGSHGVTVKGRHD